MVDKGVSLAFTLCIIHVITFFVLLVVFEIIFQCYKRREMYFVDPGQSMSTAEFD